MTENKNVDYFLRKITQYTKTHLKPIHKDNDFLNYRSRLASKAYEGCMAAGNTENLSFEIANDILLDGLRANEFLIISDILHKRYAEKIAKANKHRLIVLLVTACEPIFNVYLKDHSVGSEFEPKFQGELLQMLDTWFACNASHPLLQEKKNSAALLNESII